MIKKVKQYSDRGSIKHIANAIVNDNFSVAQPSPMPSELRMQKLFEFAYKNNDKELLAATGFITTDYIGDKTALPLSVYRIRKIVDDIKSKSSGEIDELSLKMQSCISLELNPDAQAYWNRQSILKIASVCKPLTFWRADR